MSYYLERFGTVDLPRVDTVTPVGTGPSVARMTPTLGSYHDADGTDRAALQLPYDVSLRATVVDDDRADLLTTINALKGLRGKLAQLYRHDVDGRSWCWAKLTQIPGDKEIRNVYHQEFTFAFSVRSPWYGDLHAPLWAIGDPGIYIGDGHVIGGDEEYTLDTSPKSITVTHGGNMPTDRVTITVTAGAADITALTLACGDCELEFSGTIASGTALVMNFESMTFTNDGADAWDDLERTADHAVDAWWRFEDGANTVTVTKTGGSTDSTIAFTFYETWE